MFSRVGPGLVRGVVGPESLPDGRVALESASKGNLPDPVAVLHLALVLRPGQLVPDRGRGGVAVVEERLPRWPHKFVRELQVVLKRVDDAPASRVDAKVVKGLLEIRNVGLHLDLEALAQHQVVEELELLGDGKHQGPQSSDVHLEGLARDGHQALVEPHTHHTIRVLLLEHAVVRRIVRTLVRADHVQQLILRAPKVLALVGEQDGRAAHPEEHVGNQHRLLRAQVEVLRDVLRADHHRVAVLVVLEEVLGQVDRDDPRTAAHSGEVVGLDVAPELELVDDHGGHGWGGVEERTVDNENVDVLWPQARLPQQVLEESEEDDLRLLARVLHGGLLGEVRDPGGQVGADRGDAGVLVDLVAHEVHELLGAAGALGLAEAVPGDLLELGEVHLPLLRGPQDGKVHQVDGRAPREEVRGEAKGQRDGPPDGLHHA
mmetsp:Transcript_14308/g.32851  ORF Transcript_14308/g.32851 Transcript_14308/m.32851 type:complete len:432 (+) Transcript_14308:80-1375(+)